MYCYVIFGESDDKHTRKYLYKCDELTPGDTVIVPVKNSQKIALVYCKKMINYYEKADIK